ncbi:hypothetical protein [Stappia sp.]|uniref:capsular polysaccharide export protein, LipB/KpsS family n=1 Tax=Stappia sp. TaxID=1870903 RepID=UPI003A99E4FD
MARLPSVRRWRLADRTMLRHARALEAVLGAPVRGLSGTPGKGEGVLVTPDRAGLSGLAGAARAAGVPLVLVAAVPVRAPVPFDEKTLVVLALPLDPLGECGEGDVAGLLRPFTGPPATGALAIACSEALATTLGEAAGLAGEGIAAGLVPRAMLYPSPYDRGRPLGFAEADAAVAAFARRADLSDRPLFCFGAKPWNHASIRAAYAADPEGFTFCADAGEAIGLARAAGGRALGWAAGVTRETEAKAADAGVELWRIEDGFLRSVGLGAGLARGASVAFDDEGIYFDATRPSRMERLLATRQLDAAERARAAALLELLRAARMTKYNVSGKTALPEVPGDREVLLVPGQVADDAGVRRSLSDVIACASCDNVNLELLRAVRARNPQAHILYKPHPDVEAGLRKGRVEPAMLAGLADQVVAGCDILELVGLADRVETFSSLSGFEALLRGRPVTVYGMPFYAGWGLTRDLTEHARRARRLDLETLVHVAFIDYPLTVDPLSLQPCTPEFLVSRLAAQRGSRWHAIMQRLRQELSWLGRKLGI